MKSVCINNDEKECIKYYIKGGIFICGNDNVVNDIKKSIKKMNKRDINFDIETESFLF